MKVKLTLILLFSTIVSFSQIAEGQDFCKETKDGSYFPLIINKKKLLWRDTFYFEIRHKTKTFNGKAYIEFSQEWDKGSTDLAYFREENGIIYEYDPSSKKENIRYDPKFVTGDEWENKQQGNQYLLLSYEGKLKTPYCQYEHLLVIRAKMKYGNFDFYYLKGHGYIGATQNGVLVSCESPEW